MAPALPRSCNSGRVSGEKEEGAGDEAWCVKGEEREGSTMPALPRYCYPGGYQGKGGWGWRPVVRRGRGASDQRGWAVLQGGPPYTPHPLRTLRQAPEGGLHRGSG